MMRFPPSISFVLMLLGLGSVAARARADTASPPVFVPQLLDAQVNYVAQQLDPLHSAYAGPLSLPAAGDQALSRTFGAYLGVRLPAHLAFYLDGELFTGSGVNRGTGLAGYVNGDVVRAGPGSGGKQRPYIARAYFDWNLPLGTASAPVASAQDQLPGQLPAQRIEIKLGRLALADDFDKNRYANDTRHQFMNWDFINAAAYDYAADTRGYTNGFIAAWVQPRWTLRYGLYQMPLQANGQALAAPLGRARAEQVQLSLRPFESDGLVLRMLAYRNIARMGSYTQALAIAAASDGAPDIVADGRSEDHVGLAFDLNGLASAHRAYLAAGGCGFLLCDGALAYGRERVIEAYYRMQLGRYLQLSPDLQWVVNPGYNRARGPAKVIGLRMHLSL